MAVVFERETRFITAEAFADDIVPAPPSREEFLSPTREYVFVVSTTDNWKSRKSLGELFRVAGEVRKLMWSRRLPHEFRPRYVLVGDEGQVLMLDEWVNIKSRYAVMVLKRDNQVIAQHDFDSVQATLGVPVAAVVRIARHGWWIVSPPAWEISGQEAKVEAAGKVLRIRLSDGHLFLDN